MSEKKYRVQRDRGFKPHQILISTARDALENAEKREPGWLYHELTAITFSALALEALNNSFGEKLIVGWKDYESANPIAKLRIICAHLGIESDFQKEPFATIKWLMKFRNSVAHAKPEFIEFDETMTREESEKIRFEFPKSKLEMGINLDNAKKSISSIDEILELFYPKLNSEEQHYLYHDGFSGSVSVS